MTEPESPAPMPVRQSSGPPQQPAIADALRALGPDYEEALINSIAERVDELARQREARGTTVAAPPRPPDVRLPGAPSPLPIPAPAPAPVPAPAAAPRPEPHHRQAPNPAGAAFTVSILSIILGFIVTIVALTAGFSDGGALALVAILIVWAGLVAINLAAWRSRL